MDVETGTLTLDVLDHRLGWGVVTVTVDLESAMLPVNPPEQSAVDDAIQTQKTENGQKAGK